MTEISGLTCSGLIPVGGNVWALAMDSGDYAFAGTAGDGVLRSVRSTTTRDTETKAPPNATTAPLEGLLIDAGANRCAPGSFPRRPSALRVISSGKYALRGLAISRESP